MKALYIVFGMLVLLASGCAIRMADLTVVSIRSSNIPAKSVGSPVRN